MKNEINVGDTVTLVGEITQIDESDLPIEVELKEESVWVGEESIASINGIPVASEEPVTPTQPETLTEKIKNYRKEFSMVTGGWNYQDHTEILTSLQHRLASFNDMAREFCYDRGRVDNNRIAAEIADVIIIAMDHLISAGYTLEQIIEGRMRSNIDRAERATEAAKIKRTTTEDEWHTTERTFEI